MSLFAGFYCKASGQSAPFGPCASGHFCLAGALSPTPEDGVTGDRCPRGHYCPVGSSFPLPCPPGYYSNSSKNIDLSACLPCPAGECANPLKWFISDIGLEMYCSECCINLICLIDHYLHCFFIISVILYFL